MTTDPLSVAAISLDIAFADKRANLDEAVRSILSLGDTAVAVLPELFTTGFIKDAEATRRLAETDSGETITTLKSLSARTGTAICGSFIATDGTEGKIYNRCFFITPDGAMTTYDKHHLFVLGEEADIYSPGQTRPPVIEYLGWKFSMACCYDLRFPCWLRNSVVDDAPAFDVLIIPANWPDERAYAWHHLIIARAIENMVYVIGANRSGEDPWGTYQDLTEIVDYKGKPLASTVVTELHSGKVTRSALSMKKLSIYRKAFPAWREVD